MMVSRVYQATAGLMTALLVLGTAGCAAPKPADQRTQRVEQAMTAASDQLLSQRTGDHWATVQYFYSQDDPHAYGATACHVLLLNHLGITPESRDLSIEYLLETQGTDGDWGNADANLAGVLALRQAGPVKYAEVIARGEAYIAEHGQSPSDCLLHTQMFYALSGEYSWAAIMDPAEYGLDIEGLETKFDQLPEWTVYQFFATQLLRFSTQAELTDRDREQADDMVEYLLAGQQLDGSWMSATTFTSDVVLALHEARGMQDSESQIDRMDEAIAKGVAFMCDDRQCPDGYVSLYNIEVTESAIALRALLESGMDPEEPAIRDGADWLMRCKFPCGGWGFTAATAPHNDAEDSGFCMAVLSVTDPDYAARQADFLVDEQSKDGGWAPFSKDLGPFSMKYYEFKDKELAHHAAETYFIDPSVPEISAHALTGLGMVGYGPDDEVVQNAEEYFKAVQFEDGKWYSYWWTGYVYGTSQVLSSLKDAGLDLDQPYVQGAVDWLLEHQHPDGGWGEDERVIRDPEWAGRGPSNTMHTAVAIIALLDVGERPDSPAVTAGIDYLIESQRPDGGWDDDNQLSMYGDPYSNIVVSNAYALWALSVYEHAVQEQ